MIPEHILISKLDAAKRQLDMAIRLFLNQEDPISIHTLSAASHTILRDLSKQQQKESTLKDTMVKMGKPERQKDLEKMFNKAENFFKHANRDADTLLKFYPEETEWFIWDVCGMYLNLTNDNTPLIKVFNVWFNSKHPDIFDDPKFVELLKSKIIELKIDYKDRSQFLNLLPYAQKII